MDSIVTTISTSIAACAKQTWQQIPPLSAMTTQVAQPIFDSQVKAPPSNVEGPSIGEMLPALVLMGVLGVFALCQFWRSRPREIHSYNIYYYEQSQRRY